MVAAALANDRCLTDKLETWSAHDTDETIREVKAHNAVYKALCKKLPH